MKKRKWVRPLLIAAAFVVFILIIKKFFMSYPNRIKSVLRKAGVPDKLVPVIIAQAMHESDNFRSRLFLLDKNAFGMKMPKIRKSGYVVGPGISSPLSEGGTPYAKFGSLEGSVRDLLHWHDYNKTNWDSILTVQGYASYMKSKGYYGDTVTNYTAGMLRWYQQLGLIMPEIVVA